MVGLFKPLTTSYTCGTKQRDAGTNHPNANTPTIPEIMPMRLRVFGAAAGMALYAGAYPACWEPGWPTEGAPYPDGATGAAGSLAYTGGA